jgi:hypothetical protein
LDHYLFLKFFDRIPKSCQVPWNTYFLKIGKPGGDQSAGIKPIPANQPVSLRGGSQPANGKRVIRLTDIDFMLTMKGIISNFAAFFHCGAEWTIYGAE